MAHRQHEETKTPEVDENLEKDREAFIKRLNSKWE